MAECPFLEGFIGRCPFVADLYSATAIVFPAREFRIAAAVEHVRPDDVEPGTEMAALVAMLRERSGMLLDQTAAASCMSLHEMIMGGRERVSTVAAAKIEGLLPDVDLVVLFVFLRSFDISRIPDDSETAEPCFRFQMFHDRAPERQPLLERAGAGSRSEECRLEAKAPFVMIVICSLSI